MLSCLLLDSQIVGQDSTFYKLSQVEACGLQAIIGNYAVPILENRQVWGTSDETATAYLDTRDVAKMALAALRQVLLAACLALRPLSCSSYLS